MSALAGKVALVTGASRGIGYAVARALAQRGTRVAMVARTRATLAQAAASIGGSAAPFALDLTDLGALAALPRAVVDRFGGLDILVNNAGVHHRGPVWSQSPERLAEMIAVDLTAPIFLTRVALDQLRPGGVIVNIASLAGIVPTAGQATYGAAKAGLRAFSRALAGELEGRDLRCAVVSPGPVDTASFAGDLARVPSLVFCQPISSAADVADAVVACITGDARERFVPPAAGTFATLATLFPRLLRRLIPLLERRGAAAKRRYLARAR